jgi:hypothetical protein
MIFADEWDAVRNVILHENNQKENRGSAGVGAVGVSGHSSASDGLLYCAGPLLLVRFPDVAV